MHAHAKSVESLPCCDLARNQGYLDPIAMKRFAARLSVASTFVNVVAICAGIVGGFYCLHQCRFALTQSVRCRTLPPAAGVSGRLSDEACPFLDSQSGRPLLFSTLNRDLNPGVFPGKCRLTRCSGTPPH